MENHASISKFINMANTRQILFFAAERWRLVQSHKHNANKMKKRISTSKAEKKNTISLHWKSNKLGRDFFAVSCFDVLHDCHLDYSDKCDWHSYVRVGHGRCRRLVCATIFHIRFNLPLYLLPFDWIGAYGGGGLIHVPSGRRICLRSDENSARYCSAGITLKNLQTNETKKK